MNLQTAEFTESVAPDIIALDKNEQIVMFVFVRRYASPTIRKRVMPRIVSALKNTLLQLSKTVGVIPFAMIVDPEDITIFIWNGRELSEAVCSLKTPTVLQHYDAEFHSDRIFEPYLETLVEGWLRDCAYHWKSQNPPASEQIAAIGLLEQLEGGTTRSGVEISGHSIR